MAVPTSLNSSLRTFQAHPAAFWCALFVLNSLLLLPWVVLQPEPRSLVPLPPLDLPRGWYDALLFLLRRDEEDLFRLSVDFYAIVSLTALSARSRQAPRIARLCLLFYLFLLLYEVYDAAFVQIFGMLPVVYNDVMLLIDAWYLVVDLWSSQWFWFLTGSALLMLLLLVAVPYLFVSLELGLFRLRARPVMAWSGLLLWGGVGFMSFWFGVDSYRSFTRWITPRVFYNLRESVDMYQTLQKFDEPVESTYFTYSNIRLLRKPNVYLFMIESYGEILAEHPEVRRAYSRLMAEKETLLSTYGWLPQTNYSTPPGRHGSWLSIATLLSGMRLDNQRLYSYFISQSENVPHLVKFFQQQGYHTLTLQPPNRKRPGLSLKNDYGFQRSLFFEDLKYDGERYGWGIVPDQYSLNYAHEMFVKSVEAPLFLFFETVTPHAPWNRLPPYVTDWRKLGGQEARKGIPSSSATKGVLGQTEQRKPQGAWQLLRATFENHFRWNDLLGVKDYFKHIAYDFQVLEDYILQKVPADSLIIIIGDHQPPVITGRERGSATPVHILTQDRAVAETLQRYGFVPGMTKEARKGETIRHEAIFSLLVRLLAQHYGSGETRPLPPYRPNGVSISLFSP